MSKVHITVLQPSSAVKLIVVVPSGKMPPDGMFPGSALTVTLLLHKSFAIGVL